jgi:hypothetical protein
MADDDKTIPTITLGDLYGKSDSQRLDAEHLVYEETPIITPVAPEADIVAGPGNDTQALQPETGLKPKTDPAGVLPKGPGKNASLPRRQGGILRTVIFLTLIFFLGIGLSVLYRNFVLQLTGEGNLAKVNEDQKPEETESLDRESQDQVTTMENETTDTNISSDNRAPDKQPAGWEIMTPAAGITYRLPPDVLPPVCDGSGCPSQGTYLTGGTRLTVAYYGNKLNRNLLTRTTITDAAGKEFMTSEASVSGQPALSFSGNFVGTTTGGYRFTRMRGYMVLTPTGNTLEISHFTPAGITADFDSDETLFEEIVMTVNFR